jgi:hypothetical protein
MSFDLQRIYELLPAIDRIRDVEQGEPLKALLTVIAEQVAVLEEDLAQSYDDHFIETCAEWVIPYVGDLIGCRGLHDKVPGVSSPRAEVANTIGYRRRKGTVVALEQLARDVTGWHAHVVEFFQRLATTQYMNHIRPDNRSPYIGGLTRDIVTGDLSQIERPLWEPLERLNTPSDSLAHTLDVRRIPPRRGRYNIPNIGIFLWRLNSYPLTDAQPFKLDDRRYFFSPLGNDTPLFTLPQTQEEFSGLSTRMNVPDPISRRTLDEYLQDYYGPGKSLLLQTKGLDGFLHPVSQDQITVCDLSDTAGGLWVHQPKKLIAIDPVLGRIAFPSEPDLPAVSPADVRVTFHYGFSADMGGGEYDRSATIGAEFLNTADVKRVTWQIGVTGKLAQLTGELVATLAEAVQAWNAQSAGAVGVIVIMDSGSYDAELVGANEIVIREGSELLIVAADWPQVTDSTGQKQRVRGQFNASGCRPDLRGNIKVQGVASSVKNRGKLFLNGLLIQGSLTVTDKIQSLSMSHSTLVPGLGLSLEGFPRAPREPSLVVISSDPTVPSDVSVAIDFSIVGGIRADQGATTSVTNSIVDATSRCGVAFSGFDDHSAGGTLHVENSTLIGKVHTALMELATNTIFFARLAAHDAWLAPVLCEQRQAGCIRFSYVPPGSRTPRRYHCQPATDDDATRVAPQFSSLRFGEPAYAQLSRRCAPEIFNGADDESEMGAFHDLFEPQRITNLGVRLDEYLRFGLEAGIFFEPRIESRAVAAYPYGYGAVADLCGDEMEQLPGIGAGLI